MTKGGNKKEKRVFFEKAVVTWLQYDPFVKIVIGKSDRMRRDIMLNLLGSEVAAKHFGDFPPLKPQHGPIFPQIVRDQVDKNLQDAKKRSQLIKKLIYWATDPNINNRYSESHQTRIQIISSLLGPIFFHSDPKQENMILAGLKFMLSEKKAKINIPGEQSLEVHEMLLDKIIDLLVHNQKVIINKAMSEAEDKMKVNLLRQIQELKGDKHTPAYTMLDKRIKRRKIIKEKFPLRHDITKELLEILEFYENSKWFELKSRAKLAHDTIREIRKPLTLTDQEATG